MYIDHEEFLVNWP